MNMRPWSSGWLLADFKVPATIWIAPALPKNAIGKLDRRKLPARFNSTAQSK
jgi:non-ribosomal peptide synthetase component E (peptide arylation enzyme)